MAAAPIEVVLFDLGGVLIDFGGVGPMRALANIGSDEELWQRWLTCRWVRRFERGGCSPQEFAEGVVADWELPITPAAFLDAFRDWPGAVLPAAEELVDAVRQVAAVGCLSNTNAVHWDAHYARMPILDALTYRFLSFEIGMVKPDEELFEHVAAALPASRDRVLFLDDNIMNVDAAAAAGFAVGHVRGVAEARAALVAAGVLAG